MKQFLSFICVFFITGISFAQVPQVPNSDFENWINDSTASNWTTMLNAGITTLYFGHKTTGLTGNALQVHSKLIDLGFTTYNCPGIATLGSISINGTTMTGKTTGGVAFIASPDSLRGYFKYAPDAPDTAIVFALLTKYNTGLSKTDTVGYAYFSNANAVSVFTDFSVPFTYYSSIAPDTMNITILSSGAVAPRPNGVLVIDNLVVKGGNVGVDELSIESIQSIQPNPNKGKFKVLLNNFNSGSLKIYNLIGNEVYSDANFKNGQTIDLGTVSRGLYLVSIHNGKNQSVRKVVIQ